VQLEVGLGVGVCKCVYVYAWPVACMRGPWPSALATCLAQIAARASDVYFKPVHSPERA
jgi:hypothetical protein